MKTLVNPKCDRSGLNPDPLEMNSPTVLEEVGAVFVVAFFSQ